MQNEVLGQRIRQGSPGDRPPWEFERRQFNGKYH